MAMTPSEVNGLSDASLRERVHALANSLNQPAQMPALVPFMTYGLLLRLHAEVVTIRAAGGCPWSKQALVGLVMASLTGVRLPSKADC